jgi:hypothetical protein
VPGTQLSKGQNSQRKTNKGSKKRCWLRSTGRSGAVHRTVRCTVCKNSSLSGFSLATSAINHRTVRARHRTVRCSNRATATCHIDKSQRSYGAPDGPVPPQKRKPANQGILYRDMGSYCSLSGVHRTVRCTYKQKARIAYQMELQRLLAALGL